MAEQDEQLLTILEHDESCRVERVLADKPGCKTELVWHGSAGPFVRKRIPRELASLEAWRIAAEIVHPRLPRVRDMYELPDLLVVVSDYVAGETLTEYMRIQGRPPAGTAVVIALNMCDAAGALHKKGVVHRDITPNNVVLASDGAHLVDLGIARVHTEEESYDTTALGTWGFAAPEQFGFAQTDMRSDVYSIGCLLGYMLTGKQPKTPAYIRALDDAAQVGPSLAQTIRTACAFEPSKRYEKTEALASALREAAAEAGIQISGVTEPMPVQMPAVPGAMGTPRKPGVPEVSAAPATLGMPASPDPTGPLGMFPIAPTELFKNVVVAHKQGNNQAIYSLVGAVLLAFFWLVTAFYGMGQPISVGSICAIIFLFALAFASFCAFGFEGAAAKMHVGIYAGLSLQECRIKRTKRMGGWGLFLVLAFFILVLVGACVLIVTGNA